MGFCEVLNDCLNVAGKDYVWLCSQLRDIGVVVLPQTVKRWVDGKSIPRPHTMVAVAKVLGISMDMLCGVSDA